MDKSREQLKTENKRLNEDYGQLQDKLDLVTTALRNCNRRNDIERMKEEHGLKWVVRFLEDSLERTEWHKVGLRLINDYQRIGKIEDIETEYENQYPTDKDLE